MTFIVDPMNEREAEIISAFLKSLSIKHYTEIEEDVAFLNSMEAGRSTRKLTNKEHLSFLKKLRQGK